MNYDRVPIPAACEPPRVRAAQTLLGPLDLADEPADLQRRSVPGVEGERLDRDADRPGLIRVTFNGDRAQKAEQWDMPRKRIRFVGQGPEGAVYLLEDGDGGRLLQLTPAAR